MDKGYAGRQWQNQVISNTGFESPCSTKGESFRFSPLDTPSVLCPPQEVGLTLNLSVFPLGFSLFQECLHSLFDIFGFEKFIKVYSF